MQSSSNESIVHHPCQSHPTFISIDEQWLSSSMIGLKQSLLTCPICYTIPLDYPIECNKCERLFCKKDYEKVVHSQNQQQNKCPTCKSSPWVKKEQIHITYKHMFDSLRLKCKICEENSQPQPQPQQTSFLSAFKLKKQQSHPKEMTKEQLIEHLQSIHDMFLSPDSILYDYVFVSDQGIEYKLSWIQNLQINVRKSMGIESFEIGGNNGKVINVNLKEKLAQHPTLGTCKIVSGKTRTLKRNKQYIVWTVDIAEKPLQFEYPQINGPSHYFSSKYQHQRYVFYSEQLQAVIEKNYQEFVKNERLNEFCLDVRQTRFRISFEEMTQTNTYTKNQKPIIRVPITLR